MFARSGSWITCVVLLVGACGGGGETEFIAEQSDFADYTKWGAIYLGTAQNTGHPIGEEYGYRSKKASSGKYPIGTILVKEIHVGSDEQQWELFAMAKRGSDGMGQVYNEGGADGWEYFTLRLNQDLVPIIETEGSNPSDPDQNGHGYGQAENGITCNRCHGVPGTAATDHVLSAGLRP
jgi:hypothetical protein